MASIAISASLQRACSSHHVIKKQHSLVQRGRALGVKQTTNVVAVDVESNSIVSSTEKQEKTIVHNNKPVGFQGEPVHGVETVETTLGFHDERWKNGTWDLNMFVKGGNMDWDSVIVAEATRRKFLEIYPEAATNQTPVVFRSSIIPWWAWIKRSHLPEAELLNGRAAMLGFFMAYIVDGLTGMDVVGQTGNFICKAGLFMTVIGIMIFRKKEDIGNLQKLVDEATFYDKQWQASWPDSNGTDASSKQEKKTE